MIEEWEQRNRFIIRCCNHGRCQHNIVLFGARARYTKNAAVLGVQKTHAKDRRFSSTQREYYIVLAAVY